MDGIHDLGGRHGFGGSLEQRDEEIFHAQWEKRVLALVSLAMGSSGFNIDEFRHAIERLDPLAYLSDGYYGRWLGATELLMREASRRPATRHAGDPTSSRQLDRPARFVAGQTVRARNLHPAGHIRLPAYVRGHLGTVELNQGAWVLPDSRAHGGPESPDYVYAVRFSGDELWGESAEKSTSVCIDLFECYLEPA